MAITVEIGTPEHLSSACAAVAARIVRFGGTVVVPENSPLLHTDAFLAALVGRDVPIAPPSVHATIAYGERFLKPGFHIMQTPTDHPVETLTGLGATGVEVMLVCIAKAVWQSHPMVPLIQVSGGEGADLLPLRSGERAGVRCSGEGAAEDLDLVLTTKDPARAAGDMLGIIVCVLGRQYTPKLFAQGNTDFQMTRGLLGVSL